MHAMEHTQRPARLNILGQPVEPALPTPAPLTSLPDYEQQARQHIEASAWQHIQGGAERQHTLELVQRAENAGYEAIVWTVDASIKRSGFALPAGVQAANLRHIAPRPQASSIDGPPLFGTPLVQQAPRWDELRWLRAHPAAAGCQRRVAPGAGPPAGRCGGGCAHHLQPRRAGAGRRGQPAGSAARHRPGGACAAAAR